MYDGDSFYTLTMADRVGLVLVSAVLVAGTVTLFLKISRPVGLALKILSAIAFFWLFEWLSPQFYYLYYLQIFDFLEFKNVIQAPPGPSDIFALLTFSDRANLSSHSRGVLGWALIALGFWTAMRSKRQFV